MFIPEKIYLYPSLFEKGKILDRWFFTRYNQDSIEYTRTDAFIRKACDWLKNNASNYIIEHPFSSDIKYWLDLEAPKMEE